ncbi:MAG: hypothetical protein JSU08_12525 [Acidobacteria bacterium]|nr:hypothetical protein [Acidobacteriota bacterium]
MTSQELLNHATRLAAQMKEWSEEATRQDALDADDLTVLRNAAAVIERATEKAALRGVNDTPEQQQMLTGESVTRPDDTLGG